MLGRILLATDGSEASCAATRMAAALAQRDRSTVFVISVLDLPWPETGDPDALVRPGGPVAQERQRKVRGSIEQQIRDCGADPSTWIVHTESGTPAPAIARYAGEHRIDLIVLGLGSHTHADRLLGHETALRVIQTANVPVLAVHVRSTTLPRCGVAALDFSELSTRAARLAAQMVEPTGELHLVHVSHLPPQRYDFETTIDADALDLESEEVLARELARSGGPNVSSSVVKGEGPAKQILEFARARGADLIACGSRGRGFAGRMVMGSVVAELVRDATCTILVVPPAEKRPA
jgi:nucleotide-binding universal stress UspA family protein